MGAADRPLLPVDIEAGHRAPPGRGAQQRRQHAHRRRLARPVGAQHAEDLAVPHLEVDAIDRHDAAGELAP